MVAIPQFPTMTETEYLAFDRASDTKHEYIHGEVVAMSGASEAHNLITVNCLVALKNGLHGKPCKVYPSDMRLKVAATGLYAYPDVSVVCGEAQFSDDALDTLLNPTVLIEVLSPSTERFDRGRKAQAYRQLPSLQVYLLIAQDVARVEEYRRQAENTWILIDHTDSTAQINLSSIGCRMTLVQLYEQVTLA